MVLHNPNPQVSNCMFSINLLQNGHCPEAAAASTLQLPTSQLEKPSLSSMNNCFEVLKWSPQVAQKPLTTRRCKERRKNSFNWHPSKNPSSCFIRFGPWLAKHKLHCTAQKTNEKYLRIQLSLKSLERPHSFATPRTIFLFGILPSQESFELFSLSKATLDAGSALRICLP